MQKDNNTISKEALLLLSAKAHELVAGTTDARHPVDLVGIARDLNVIQISRQKLASHGLLIIDGSDYRIILNSSDHPTRQRFTLAHELGHIIVEDFLKSKRLKALDQLKLIFLSSKVGTDSLERICNKLAVELLFPKHLFLQEIEKLNPSLAAIRYLCKRFDASPETILLRLRDVCAWDSTAIVWKFKSSPNNSRDLRISWFVKMGRGDEIFVPIHKSANRESSAYQSYITESDLSFKTERLSWRPARERYSVESGCFRNYPHKFVISLVKKHDENGSTMAKTAKRFTKQYQLLLPGINI